MSEKEKKKTGSSQWALKAIILFLVLVIGVLCGMFFQHEKQQEAIRNPDPVIVQSEINDIAELVTLEYNYTNMAKYENHEEFYGVKIPFTTNKFIITYDGVILAGVNMAEVTVTKTEDNKLAIRLPAARILAHSVDFDSLQVTDESYSIFNKLEITDYAAFTADEKLSTEAKALAKGILKKAEENAEVYLRNFVSSLVPGAEIIFR